MNRQAAMPVIRARWVFLLGVLPPLLFAAVTQHAWEDWYIAYRSARHLALGAGLVFEPGERLQTFTSPINVLLPALYRWLTGSDAMVLLIHRIACALLMGCACLNVWRVVQRERLGVVATVFLLVLFATDSKTVDFSVNGLETAFVMFFFSLTLRALFEERPWLLGVAWAGLLWSRPDSFLYIAALGLAYAASHILDDRSRWKHYGLLAIQSGVMATLLYAPWLLWSAWYYGSPVPHTIVAKGLHTVSAGPLELLLAFVTLPFHALANPTAMRDVFAPTNYFFGGWPQVLEWVSYALSWVAAIVWLLPRMSPLLRTASFALYVGLFYLTHLAAGPYAWYFPPCTLLAVIVWAGLLDKVLGMERLPVVWRRGALAVAASLVLFLGTITVLQTWQMKVQQTVIEEGGRKQVGLWLREHAQGERETVFVESLGYIGFFSGLEMYDYPGIASPEVVQARREHGDEWNAVIRALQPDWLVLRQREVWKMSQMDASIIEGLYYPVAVFDQSAALAAYRFVPGRAWLEYDQAYIVFRRADLLAAPAGQ